MATCDEQGTKTHLHLAHFLVSMKCNLKVLIDGFIYVVVNASVLVVICYWLYWKVIIIFIHSNCYRHFIRFNLFVVIALVGNFICKVNPMRIYFYHLIFWVLTFFIRVFLSCEFSYFLSMNLPCKMMNWIAEFILLVKSLFSSIGKNLLMFYMPGLRGIMLLDCSWREKTFSLA